MPAGDNAGLDRGPGRSLRRRSRDESGNIIVMFAVFVPVFILVCAIAIDVGYWWVNAKKAQIAADACALAAAGDPLFPPPADARYGVGVDDDGNPVYLLDHCRFGYPAERDYVRTNLHLQSDPAKSILHESTTVETPYKKDEDRVEATVEIKVNTFFGTYVGLDSVDIVRRAVAEVSTGVNEVAIHAHDANCENNSLILQNGPMNIDGVVESNGDFEVNGKDIKTGPATGVHAGTCKITVSGPGMSFGGQPKPTHDPVPHPWPVYYMRWEDPFGWVDSGTSSCDFTKQNFEFKDDNAVLDPGIYCATEDFKITGKNIRGQITVLSPHIVVNGEGSELSPAPEAVAAGKPVLFFQIPNLTAPQDDDGPFAPNCEFNKDMEINEKSFKWTGILFHPCGHIRINAEGNAALEGMIVAQTVKIDGKDFSVKKISDIGANKKLALWE